MSQQCPSPGERTEYYREIPANQSSDASTLIGCPEPMTTAGDDVPRGGVAYAIAVPSELCRISLPQRAG